MSGLLHDRIGSRNGPKVLRGALLKKLGLCRTERRQTQLRSNEPRRSGQAVVLPAQIYHYMEKSQETARSLYLRALPGPLKWAPSFLVPLSAFLGIAGSTNAHHILEYLYSLDVPDWLPVAAELQYHYSHHAQLANIAVDALAASLGVLLVFFGLPALDLLLGQDPGLGTKDEKNEAIFKTILRSHAVLYWLALGSAAWTCSSSEIHPLTVLSLALTTAQAGAMSFVASHELLHSPKAFDKTMASFGLMPLGYMHWVPSHIAHHRKVGTPQDPTTARLGETLYTFLPRTVLGNIRDGIEIELLRLRSRGISAFSPQNRIFQWVFGPLGLLLAIYSAWGLKAACMGILQALVADLMLETVNYVEHYGLTRRPQPNGKLERVTIHHSWNANWLFTNSVILSLQRHSDHHAHAYKPFQELQNLPNAPQLPASYPVMMILAFFPGLYLDVMNPRALAAVGPEPEQ